MTDNPGTPETAPKPEDGSGSGSGSGSGRRFPYWAIAPLVGAATIFAVAAWQLISGTEARQPGDLLSVQIGGPAPEFALPALYEGEPDFSTASLQGAGVKLVNLWGSWCGPCRVEHPHLMALAEQGVAIYGINLRDRPGDAMDFLESLGNPYVAIGADRRGRTMVEWGSTGVPETFIIDGEGRIVYRHIGPILPHHLETVILPEIEKAGGSAPEG